MTPFVQDEASGLPIGPFVEATPARRPERGHHQGRFVELVPLDPAAHAGALYANSHGPGCEALWLYLGQGPFPDRASFEAHLAACAASSDPLFFAILDRARGEAVGYATFMRIEPAQRVIEVGNILFTPKLQRTPAASEAMYLMARHAFDDLGYRRYEWKCNALNAPSRRAAERYGFVYEGLFRQHMIVKGRSRDTAWYAMLDGEWPARKAAFERWLDPANFDDRGRQRLSLAALNAATLAGHEAELRRASPADAAALAALHEAAFAPNRAVLGVEPLPLTTAAEEVVGRYETWLVGGEDALAAALVLDPRPDHLLIWSVAAAPAAQRQGLGTRLLRAAEARARALGLAEIRLYTGEKLTRTVRWYHRHGYVIEGSEERADRRLVHLSKRLD